MDERLMKRIAMLLVASFLASSLLAQTAEDRARIDYAAAKKTLEEGKPEVALEKLVEAKEKGFWIDP